MILRRVYSNSLDRVCGAMHLIEEKIAFYLLMDSIFKKKNIKAKKEVFEVLIHFS